MLTHGFNDSGDTWEPVWPWITAHLDALRWDLLGHGRSEKPATPAAYSRETALADLRAMIARVGEPVILIGHSFGGYLSLLHAIERPASVRALVLLATGPGFRDPTARDRWNESTREGARAPVPAVAGGLVQQHDSKVIDGLAGLTMPTLLLLGERDRHFAAAMDHLQKRLPHARATVVRGAGHMIQKHRPDEVQVALEAFCASL